MVAEYERLREFALGSAHMPGLGWAVFLRRGMCAWAETWRDLTPSPRGVPVQVMDTVPSPASAAVVQVLAAMVLAVHQGSVS
jgi:hypothetical protein